MKRLCRDPCMLSLCSLAGHPLPFSAGLRMSSGPWEEGLVGALWLQDLSLSPGPLSPAVFLLHKGTISLLSLYLLWEIPFHYLLCAPDLRVPSLPVSSTHICFWEDCPGKTAARLCLFLHMKCPEMFSCPPSPRAGVVLLNPGGRL